MLPDCVLIKISTDNRRRQTERCSDDRSSRSLHTLLGKPSTASNTPWGEDASVCGNAGGRSNPAEEIGFLEDFVNLI